MTDDQIHDLLDRAVREHQPRADAPWRSVARRARRRRRRNVVLAAAGTLVVALGVTTAIGVVPGVSPVAPAGVGGTRLLMSEREVGNGSTVYIAPEGAIILWDSPLVVTPDGWSDVPRDSAARNVRTSYECPERGNVVYRATVTLADGTLIPCIGVSPTPYVWHREAEIPNASAILEQTILPDGTVRWLITLADGPRGEATYAAVFPGLGQVAVSRGLDGDELLEMVDPPAATDGPDFAVPVGEDFRVAVQQVAVQQEDARVRNLPADGAVEFLTVLRQQSASVGSCDADPRSYQFALTDRVGTSVAFFTLSNVDGCLSLVSSFGGGRLLPTAELISLVRGAAAG